MPYVFICAMKLLQNTNICCILCLDKASCIICCPSADTETMCTNWCAMHLWSHLWSHSDSDLLPSLIPIYSSIIWSRITAESALYHSRPSQTFSWSDTLYFGWHWLEYWDEKILCCPYLWTRSSKFELSEVLLLYV